MCVYLICQLDSLMYICSSRRELLDLITNLKNFILQDHESATEYVDLSEYESPDDEYDEDNVQVRIIVCY